jgi:hypothetical protein
MKVISTLEVIDNFFGEKLPDFAVLSAQTIDDFGREVRRFAVSYTPPTIVNKDTSPSFLGGWPSARWTEYSPLVMTSILYSGQVLVKDPIIDWFCDEQYLIPHLIPTEYEHIVLIRQRSGYKQNPDHAEYNLEQTRLFLNSTIPAMVQARPLIESGILETVCKVKIYGKDGVP